VKFGALRMPLALHYFGQAVNDDVQKTAYAQTKEKKEEENHMRQFEKH